MHMHREWLEKKLREKGRGARKALADHLGLEPSAITRMVSGERKITSEEFFKIVRWFGGNAEFPGEMPLEVGEPIDIEAEPVYGLPIVGYVAAGTWLDADEMDEPRAPKFFVPPDTRFPLESQRVWIVQGKSVERSAKDGEALICVTLEDANPKSGDLVIAERTRDQGALIERTAKRLRYVGSRAELVPEYLDAARNVPLPLGTGQEGETVRIIAVVIGRYSPLR